MHQFRCTHFYLFLFVRSQNSEDRPNFTDIVDELLVLIDEIPESKCAEVSYFIVYSIYTRYHFIHYLVNIYKYIGLKIERRC